jgi:hypothetical protein
MAVRHRSATRILGAGWTRLRTSAPHTALGTMGTLDTRLQSRWSCWRPAVSGSGRSPYHVVKDHDAVMTSRENLWEQFGEGAGLATKI